MATAVDTDSEKVTFTTFGSNGTGNDQFNVPLGMAFNRDKTEIFVADRDNNRVQVLTYDRKTGGLTFKRTISDKVDDDKQCTIKHPTGVAFWLSSDQEVIVVADRNNSNICAFSCVEPFKCLGEHDVTTPCSVAVDKDGTLFAYDTTNCRIEIFMNDGTNKYICEKTRADDPNNLGGWGTLAFDNNDQLVVADEQNNRVQVLKTDGTYIRTITGTISGGKRGGQLNRPCGIAFTEDGKNIIIADYGTDQVRVLTYADGKIVKSFGAKGSGLGQFNGPYGVLVDDENSRIIVSEENNHRIQVIHNALPKKTAKVVVKPSLVSGKSKYPRLEEAIRNAITSFSTSLTSGDDEYAKILTQLNEKIDEDRILKTKDEDDDDELEIPKLESQQLSKNKVTGLITNEKDAIFVVTGGSFNPPHNGHIGMFQKAYDALMKVTINKGKKVYGVMVPASDRWIDGKLCKEAHEKPDKCTDFELADEKSKAAIKSKRIQLAERVNLCKLSCDSYEWTSDPTKFNASNMIVVNESAQGEDFTNKPNTYYLCGSDYYKDTSKIKYICVLRTGDTRVGTNLLQASKDGKPSVLIKATDIIIEGGEDNDASSTMLRDILTKIRDDIEYDAEEPITKNLLTKQVYCELLKMGYIVGEKGKEIADSLKCSELDLRDDTGDKDTDDKDIISMKLNSKNKDKIINDLVGSFKKFNDNIVAGGKKSRLTDKDVLVILNAVYDHGHTMLINDIYVMNAGIPEPGGFKSTPLIFQLVQEKNILDYFMKNKNEETYGKDIYTKVDVAINGLTSEKKRISADVYKFLLETKRISILTQIISNPDFDTVIFGFYDLYLKKEVNTQDTLLETVNYTRQPSRGDGNCFYNSAGMQLFDDIADGKVPINYIEYNKLYEIDFKDINWRKPQHDRQTMLRTELCDYLKKIYTKLSLHPNFIDSTNNMIKYLREKGPNFKSVCKLSTIDEGVDDEYFGSDDELYFIAALYNWFIVILPPKSTVFRTINSKERIECRDDEDVDTVYKQITELIDEGGNVPPDELLSILSKNKTASKKVLFMVGQRNHWEYAIPTSRLTE